MRQMASSSDGVAGRMVSVGIMTAVLSFFNVVAEGFHRRRHDRCMTTLKWMLVVAVLGYGGLLTLMYVFQRALMYFPDATHRLPAQAGLPQAAEVALTS